MLFEDSNLHSLGLNWLLAMSFWWISSFVGSTSCQRLIEREKGEDGIQ
jgi:hypothetical protein